MKKLAMSIAFVSAVSVSGAYAGLGSLGGLASSLGSVKGAGASSSTDLNGFLSQAKSTNAMFIQSRSVLASLLANKQEAEELVAKRKALKMTSDLKEKEAIQKQIVVLTNSVLEASQNDEAVTVAKLSTLKAEQKQQLLDSATNFAIASLNALELASGAKQVSTTLMANPTSLLGTGMSLVDAKDLVGEITGIAKNATLALVEYPKLFKKAGIEFTAPASAADKPKNLDDI